MRGLADKLSPAQLSRIWQMLLKALEEASKAPDPIAAVEMAMVRICAAQSLPPPEEAARLLRDGPPASSRPSAPPSREPPRDTPTVNKAPPAPTHRLQTFEDFLRAVSDARMIELEILLDRLKVVQYSPAGDLVFVAAPDQPRDIIRQIKDFLEEVTEIEWRVRGVESTNASVESLAERRLRERQRAMEELKRQPFIAEALKHFPGAEITAVRQPQEEASGGDVVQMPSQNKTAPSPARKKEADR